jgi:hypothetical protein
MYARSLLVHFHWQIGETPFITACRAGSLPCVEALMCKFGCNVLHQARFGIIGFNAALFRRHFSVALWLLERQACIVNHYVGVSET